MNVISDENETHPIRRVGGKESHCFLPARRRTHTTTRNADAAGTEHGFRIRASIPAVNRKRLVYPVNLCVPSIEDLDFSAS
jgi:hypothetical protein